MFQSAFCSFPSSPTSWHLGRSWKRIPNFEFERTCIQLRRPSWTHVSSFVCGSVAPVCTRHNRSWLDRFPGSCFSHVRTCNWLTWHEIYSQIAPSLPKYGRCTFAPWWALKVSLKCMELKKSCQFFMGMKYSGESKLVTLYSLQISFRTGWLIKVLFKYHWDKVTNWVTTFVLRNPLPLTPILWFRPAQY